MRPQSRDQHDISPLQKNFPSEQTVPICKAYAEGSCTSSTAETPELWK